MKQWMKWSLSLFAIGVASGCSLSSTTINVVSREDGSGTRSAFVEMLEVLDENKDDMTTVEADIQNNTNGVMQIVAGNPYAIGYISLGSLDNSVKVLEVNDVAPTIESIKSGEYPIARPFNLVINRDSNNALVNDFLNYIVSPEAQQLIVKQGYVPIDTLPEGIAPQASESELSGQLTIVGSTSVTPVIEKLAEGYEQQQPTIKINITSNGSTAGIAAVQNGSANIGMSSRPLKQDEQSTLLEMPIAIDGIVIIVNNENPVKNLTLSQLQQIFKGTLTDWQEIEK